MVSDLFGDKVTICENIHLCIMTLWDALISKKYALFLGKITVFSDSIQNSQTGWEARNQRSSFSGL